MGKDEGTHTGQHGAKSESDTKKVEQPNAEITRAILSKAAGEQNRTLGERHSHDALENETGTPSSSPWGPCRPGSISLKALHRRHSAV